MMTCTGCGELLAPSGRFCGACGQATTARSTASELTQAVTGDWPAAIRVAGTTLGVSLLLAVVFGLASRPAFGNPHWGLKATLCWISWVWESIFGVDVVGQAHASGSLSAVGLGATGHMAATASLGAMPLTLTVITLAAAAIAFRRASAAHPSALAALFLAVKTALLTALALGLVSVLISFNDTDLINLLGTGNGTVSSAVGQWQAIGDRSLALSLSSAQAVGVSFTLLLAVLLATALTGGERFRHPLGARVQRWLSVPLQSAIRLCLALMVGGLLFELVTWQVRWHTAWPAGSFGGRGKPPHLSPAQWVDAFAAAIAYAGNAGLLALGLGSGSTVGFSASGQASASGLSMSSATGAPHGIAWWAGSDHLAAGIWLALLITPAVLAYLTWSIARSNPGNLRALITWVCSLAVLVPLLGFLANLTATGRAYGETNAWGLVHGTAMATGSAEFGLSLALTTATVVAYAAAMAALSTLATRRARSSATGTGPPSSPR